MFDSKLATEFSYEVSNDSFSAERSLDLPGSSFPAVEDSLWEIEAEGSLGILDETVRDIRQ
tara:strand:- start:79 stop:261 length:183 start_codon:yes stop_codon:yes gene_type:complete